jgi:hypothetical protein
MKFHVLQKLTTFAAGASNISFHSGDINNHFCVRILTFLCVLRTPKVRSVSRTPTIPFSVCKHRTLIPVLLCFQRTEWMGKMCEKVEDKGKKRRTSVGKQLSFSRAE